MKCEARQHSDQRVCARCDLAWDMNDDDPPECKPEVDRVEEHRKRIAAARRWLRTAAKGAGTCR